MLHAMTALGSQMANKINIVPLLLLLTNDLEPQVTAGIVLHNSSLILGQFTEEITC